MISVINDCPPHKSSRILLLTKYECLGKLSNFLSICASVVPLVIVGFGKTPSQVSKSDNISYTSSFTKYVCPLVKRYDPTQVS